MIIKILLCIFWMLLIPLMCGVFVTGKMKKEYRNFGMMLINGYLVYIALFQCIYLIFLRFNPDFNDLVRVFNIIIIVIAILSVAFGFKDCKEMFVKNKLPNDDTKQSSNKYLFLYIIPVLLIILQMVLRIFIRVYDGDDAFFVATAVVTEQSGTIAKIEPYTGYATLLDSRHNFASAPIFIAYLSRVTGIHATIMAHIVWADMVMLLVYATMFMIGKVLLGYENRKYLPFYMTLVALMNIFGYVSIYMPSTFFLGRTWQGKAMFAAWILPLIFLALLMFARAGGKNKKDDTQVNRQGNLGIWLLTGLVMTAGMAMTSAGIMFSPILLGSGMIFLVILKKQPIWLLYTAICCIMNAITGILFAMA